MNFFRTTDTTDTTDTTIWKPGLSNASEFSFYHSLPKRKMCQASVLLKLSTWFSSSLFSAFLGPTTVGGKEERAWEQGSGFDALSTVYVFCDLLRTTTCFMR